MRRIFQSGVLLLAMAVPCLAANPAPVAVPATGVAVLRNGFTLAFDHQETRENVIRLYLASGTDSYVDVARDQVVEFQAAPPPAALAPLPPKQPTLDEIVNFAGDRHALDADFIRSVIHAESDFNPKAVSPKGARGLMQLMPATAAQMGVRDSFDPAANVDAGVRYLRDLLQLYHGDVARALAAYNAGAARVQQYRGVPPYRETRAYVTRIIKEYNRRKLAERARAAASGSPPSSSP